MRHTVAGVAFAAWWLLEWSFSCPLYLHDEPNVQVADQCTQRLSHKVRHQVRIGWGHEVLCGLVFVQTVWNSLVIVVGLQTPFYTVVQISRNALIWVLRTSIPIARASCLLLVGSECNRGAHDRFRSSTKDSVCLRSEEHCEHHGKHHYLYGRISLFQEDVEKEGRSFLICSQAQHLIKLNFYFFWGRSHLRSWWLRLSTQQNPFTRQGFNKTLNHPVPLVIHCGYS